MYIFAHAVDGALACVHCACEEVWLPSAWVVEGDDEFAPHPVAQPALPGKQLVLVSIFAMIADTEEKDVPSASH